MVAEEDLLVDNFRSFLEWQDREEQIRLAVDSESFMEKRKKVAFGGMSHHPGSAPEL